MMTARTAGLVGCRYCAHAAPMGEVRCPTCGGRLRSRDRLSLQRVMAFWLAGVLFYIPANLYPMLQTQTLFARREDTIVGGAIELFHTGAPFVAAIVLIASVGIPLAKFSSIAFLAISAVRPSRLSMESRHRLYEIVDYIGKWSMIDVFVVAILSSLVQFSSVASIKPGIASLAFALSVIFTMLSAQSFDSRLIWDNMDPRPEEQT